MTLTKRELLAGLATLPLALSATGVAAQGVATVVATTGMIADAARQVGGDLVEVRGLMGPGVDPHSYRQTRSDIVAMARADVVLWHGLYLEAQMEEFLQDLGERGTTYAVAETLPRDLLLGHDDYEDKFDPHVWMVPDAYGFEVIGVQGISTESEAGLRRIADLVDVLVDRQIGAVFVESSVSDRNIRALIEGAAAKGHKVVIGGELFSDAMGEPGTYVGTYIGMLDHNATTIAGALGGDVPQDGMKGLLNG